MGRSGQASNNQGFSYIQVPILVNYLLKGNNLNNIKLFVGPSIDVLAGMVTSVDKSESPLLTMIFGAGFQLNPFIIEFRYDLNLTDAYVNEWESISGKLGTFTIMAGLIAAF